LSTDKVSRFRTVTTIPDRHDIQNNSAVFIWIDCTVTLRAEPKLRYGVFPYVQEGRQNDPAHPRPPMSRRQRLATTNRPG
jgi:hypothetical protein